MKPHRFCRGLALSLALLSLVPVSPAAAGGRRRATAASSYAEELAISFTGVTAGGSEALLDAGRISYDSRSRRPMTITTHTFGILIGAPSAQQRGTAALRAFVAVDDPSCIVRVDGIVLGSAPRIIDAHAPIGVIASHCIEIEVPVSTPERALSTSIEWQVTTD